MYIMQLSPVKKMGELELLPYASSADFKTGSLVFANLKAKKSAFIIIDKYKVKDLKTEIKSAPYKIRTLRSNSQNFQAIDKYSIRSIKKYSEDFLLSPSDVLDNIFANTIVKNKALLQKIDQINSKQYTKKTKTEMEKINISLIQAPEKERMLQYKELSREYIAKNKSILIVAPNINKARKILEFVQSGLENRYKLINTSNAKSIKDALSVKDATCFISTPKAITLPITNLSAIILEEEFLGNYSKMDSKFKIREFLKYFCNEKQLDLFLSDIFLSLNTQILARNEYANYKLDLVRHSLQDKKEIVDINIEKEIKIHKEFGLMYPVLSRKILDHIKHNHDKSIFIYVPKKGLASQVICNDCKTSLVCPRCISYIKLEKNDKNQRYLLCRRCGFAESANITCPVCSSWNLKAYGVTTDAVQNFLKHYGISSRILTQNISEKDKVQMIEKFKNKELKILIGTNTALNLLDQNSANITIAAGVDALLSVADFSIEEKLFAYLLKLYEISKDVTFIQHKDSNIGAIDYFTKKKSKDFIENEFELRKSLKWPPFYKIIKIKSTGNKKKTVDKMQEVVYKLSKYEVRVFKDFVYENKNRVSLIAIIKIESEKWPNKKLLSHLLEIEGVKIEIDPEKIID